MLLRNQFLLLRLKYSNVRKLGKTCHYIWIHINWCVNSFDVINKLVFKILINAKNGLVKLFDVTLKSMKLLVQKSIDINKFL
jgi:hypothetical protein